MLADQPAGLNARIDLHCHTSASFDSSLTPAALLELASARGLSHLAITDHGTIDGAAAATLESYAYNVRVIVGEEVRTLEGDVILLYVAEPIAQGLSVEETISRAREQGCLVGLPHPFDPRRPSIGLGKRSADELEDLAAQVDFIEIHNGRVRSQTANTRAADMARRFGLLPVAVSDCHTSVEVGSSFVATNGDFSNPGQFLEALARSVPRVNSSSLADESFYAPQWIRKVQSLIGHRDDRS